MRKAANMKIILSRKGFDSEYGGVPSPLLPDGRLISLPIPYAGEKIGYGDLRLSDGTRYSDLMRELGYRVSTQTCHLDPDIYRDVIHRAAGWKPAFGQIGAAQSHLDHQEVGVGDLFLFFGWFRGTRGLSDKLCFDPEDRQGRHIIFGYLQVGEKLRVDEFTRCPPWMTRHPHTEYDRRKRKNNTIYIASDRLSWDDRFPGAGVLSYAPSLVLTRPGSCRSCWALPSFFRNLSITYHSSESWQDGYFRSASRGQEFVIQESAQVEDWAKNLVTCETC